MPSWCRQVNWGNCGIRWMNCAVLCVKDYWKGQLWDLACQNCAVYSVFPLGMTSHSKIARFNWECIGRFGINVQIYQSTLTAEASLLVASLSLQRPGFSAVPICVGLCGGQTGHVKGLTPRTSTFACRYHSINAPHTSHSSATDPVCRR